MIVFESNAFNNFNEWAGTYKKNIDLIKDIRRSDYYCL